MNLSFTRRAVVGWGIAALVIIVLLGAGIGVARAITVKHSDNQVIRSMANVLPLPAAKVGSRRIYYRDFLRSRDTVKVFLASPAAKEQNLAVAYDQNLEKNVLERLLYQAALDELAEQKSVKITDAELRAYFADVVTAASSTTPDMGVYLLNNFGWTEEDFRQQVLRPALLEQRLTVELGKEGKTEPSALGEMLDARLKEKDVVRYLKF